MECSLSRNFVHTTPLLLLVRNTIQLLLVVIVVASELLSRDPKPALAALHVSVFHVSIFHVRVLAGEIDTLAVGTLGAALREGPSTSGKLRRNGSIRLDPIGESVFAILDDTVANVSYTVLSRDGSAVRDLTPC